MAECSRCLLSDEIGGVHIHNGECNFCRSYRAKWESASRQREELAFHKAVREIRDDYAGRCVVPLSGGIDSAYTAYYVKSVLGLNPVAVTFHNGFQAPFAAKVISRLKEKIGLDHVYTQMDEELKKRVYQTCFKKVGEVCTACNSLIYWSVYKYSADNGLPHIVFGVCSRSENSPIYDGVRYCRDSLFREILSGDLTEEEIHSVSVNKVMANGDFRLINLPDFVDASRDLITGELIDAGILDHEDIIGGTKHRDCLLTPLNSGTKKKKYGFKKKLLTLAFLVREGQLTREDALSELSVEYGKVDASEALAIVKDALELDDADMAEYWQRSRMTYVKGKRTVREIIEAYEAEVEEDADLETRIAILVEQINSELLAEGGALHDPQLVEKGLLKLKASGVCRVCVLKDLVLTNFSEAIFLRALPDDVKGVMIR